MRACELSENDRPTVPAPAPRESEIRLRTTRIPSGGATVDVVVCDLSQDPRSEDFRPRPAARVAILPPPRRARPRVELAQNDMPPSTSTVRALK